MGCTRVRLRAVYILLKDFRPQISPRLNLVRRANPSPFVLINGPRPEKFHTLPTIHDLGEGKNEIPYSNNDFITCTLLYPL